MTLDDRTTHPSPRSSITELSELECYDLLVTTTVGRVAFVNAEGQQLLPLNFVLVDGVVYFRTLVDGVLAELASGMPDAAFGVDYHGVTTRDGWSVTIVGATSVVDDPETLDQVSNHSRLRPWVPGERLLIIQLIPRAITGRRVSAH